MGVVMRATRLVGLIVALAMVTALAFSAQAAPPAQFQENQIVLGPDGSLFVFEGGQLHPIQPVRGTADQISAAPRGSAVTTGVTILPEPAGPAVGPPFGEAFGVRVTVLEVQRPFSPRLGGIDPREGLEWMLVRLRIDNLTNETLVIGKYVNDLWLEDAAGRTRDWLAGGSTPPVPDEQQGGTILPGRFVEGNAIMAVPVGVPFVKVLWVLRSSPLEVVEVVLR